MSIANYKKLQKEQNFKILELEHFKVKLRKLKVRDYLNTKGLPSIFSLSEEPKDPEELDAEGMAELFGAIKNFVCSCVIADPENDMPGIVDKPESECADFEISFDDTLADEDATAIFHALQGFVTGGLGQDDNLATFPGEQDVREGHNGSGEGIPQVSA